MYKTLAAAGLAALASAVPVEQRQSGPTDVQILNYALTLEHLENTFYHEGLKNFTAADFAAAGVTDSMFYNNLKQISSDEETHVSALSSALGCKLTRYSSLASWSLTGFEAAAVKQCTYNFGVTDAKTFLAVANVLEGVGVSAYLGAAKFIMSKDYLTTAGSILTVESRHSAYLRRNQNPALSPFPSPFDIPLDFDEVYTLAAQFIASCPSSNTNLPMLKAFPAITVMPAGIAKPGDKLTLKTAKTVDAKAAYFITATGAVQAPLSGSGCDYTVTIPDGVQKGQEYLVLTSAAAKPSDDNIVAGPAVVEIADNAFGQPQGGMAGSGGNGGSGSGSGSGSGASPNPYGSYGKYGSYGSYGASAGGSGKVTQIGSVVL